MPTSKSQGSGAGNSCGQSARAHCRAGKSAGEGHFFRGKLRFGPQEARCWLTSQAKQSGYVSELITSNAKFFHHLPELSTSGMMPPHEKPQDLPAVYRGPCCLDVDLAFVGPSDPRRATVVGHDGTLAFEVRSLRVPPFDHGYVSLRVVEAARLNQPKASSWPKRCGVEGRTSTKNGEFYRYTTVFAWIV